MSVELTASAAGDTADHFFRLAFLVAAIISLAKTAFMVSSRSWTSFPFAFERPRRRRHAGLEERFAWLWGEGIPLRSLFKVRFWC